LYYLALEEGTACFWNVENLSPKYAAAQPRRPESSNNNYLHVPEYKVSVLLRPNNQCCVGK